MPGTETWGRSGFFIHTSDKSVGTHGCIEIVGNTAILSELRQVAERVGTREILLVVKARADDGADPAIMKRAFQRQSG